MTLQEFAEKFSLNIRTAFRYRDGDSIPQAKTARRLEEMSSGELTVEDLCKKVKGGPWTKNYNMKK